MKKHVWLVAVLAVMLSMTAFTGAEAKGSNIVLGYTTGDGASYHSLTSYHSYLNAIAPDTYAFDQKGNIIGETPKKQLSYAKKKKIKTWAVISNYNEAIQDFDGNLASRVMTNKTARKHFADQLVKLAKKQSFTGINIDFEAVKPGDRAKYSSLIQYVANTLKKHKIKTMVSVPAKSADHRQDDWSWPFDYAKIGKYADYVQVMTYDEHGVWSSPGSVASTNWIKGTLKYAVKTIKANKVIMGIPSYGNDWDLTDQHNSKMLQWNELQALKKKVKAKPVYNKKSGSMTFSYKDGRKHKHVVWYEDEKTIQAKSRLAKQYKIAGVSVYALGHESASFWKAIQKGLK
ncbi:glycosyl hydrolase family 18 protein [Bacillus sonorensis]|uniref:glycosyl hydrolase family 18 protein n=1 Tax=Bacillus sonorensis TaxID=119858 RepID=UPI0022814AC1|nr:glycosyl hydrolase family 18 protein [Bacillus sonorensis]MCY8403958.1 glycosyl hydrolase family 18 protein [Bacillus sonorensis]MCZ0070840.1 glycosyl hydrolase family 18 protein [Bacillus sonorensis]MCZ0098083.1 glycosyl hydrolase family 18 protein [Bacillus sonorensis]MEC1353697.1 glycosyl hydrolase family 18 protein [Bacillus sonorensis]MEC1427756.1 glycosyl hydrolase family 18 protein [Bacillus sonorensis]